MKKKFRGISLLVVILLVTTFISVKKSEASDVATQPNFTIQNLKATPDPAKVGEDILVTGQIVPQDFETTVQAKEIVLVLDTSGSMNEEITLDEECTEKRVRYCTTHNSSNPNHYWWGNHKWRDDYCEIHEKIGKHNKVSTKINEIKKATESFIETMNNVPNLKIGIIEYSTNATILSELKDANDKSLITSIAKLNADGGTNIREGLRKAAYLFSKGNNNANKTIVLMTDGNPTYYSTYEKLDDTKPWVYGKGNSTDNNTMTYTKNLAEKQISGNNYNSYSIGYGLNNSGTEYLKSIHSSMRGLDSNIEVNETNGFFAKSDGSITEIFNQIAENIKASYDLNEVSLEIEFNQGFKLNIEGNEINVGNITYNKVSESGGRVIYHAEPVDFNFIVKASEIGQNQSIFNKLTIKYPWNNTIKEDTKNETLNVNIVTNDLPSISAELLSGKTMESKKGNEIKLEYEINPEDFYYNNVSNSENMDIVVVLEDGYKEGNTFIDIRNALWNKLIDKLPKDGKMKFSLILFDNKGAKNIISLKDYSNSSNYYGDLQSKISNLENGNDTNSASKAIYTGLSNAYDELIKNSRANASKNIIIISNNKTNYNKNNNDYESLFNKIKSEKYNIVTLSLENEDKDSDLYKVHKYLGADDSNILYNNNTDNGVNNNMMDLVREKLLSYTSPKPYEFNPEIKLNLGNNFTAVKGIDSSGIIKIPTITYNLTQNNNYSAKSQFVEVTLKINNLPSGEYGFGVKSDNTMTYSSLLGESVMVNLETPIVKIKDDVKDLEHGLYEGVKNNSVELYNPLEGNKTIISPGATVTFGAKFITSNDDFELALYGDSKFNKIKTSDIKVYKLDKTNNSLVEITNPKDETDEKNLEIKDSENNKFIIKASNLNNNSKETEIVVIYKGRIKDDIENEIFINSVKISDLNAEVRIKSGSSSNSNNQENEEDYQEVLPDLF